MAFEFQGILLGHGAVGLSLTLLVLGHVLADFVFQSRRMVAAKDRPGGLLLHGGLVFVVHTVVYLPLLSLASLAAILGVSVVHVLVDAAKRARVRRRRDGLSLFLLDQAVHVFVLLGVWAFLLSQPDVLAAGFLAFEAFEAWADLLTVIALLIIVVAFNGSGAAAVVSLILADTPAQGGDLDAGSGQGDGHGRRIGMLERWLVVLFVLVGAWIGIGLVVAAKSIARFDRIRQEPLFAERYLVGTLGSLLIAAVSGIAAIMLVGPFL